MPGLPMFMFGMALATGLAAPAFAESTPRTRLVECRSTSCLLISGSREDNASGVSINGHAVPVKGGRKWQVLLPVDTVRAWSAPSARTIMVSVAEGTDEADLPIGLLGQSSDLAMLVVRAK